MADVTRRSQLGVNLAAQKGWTGRGARLSWRWVAANGAAEMVGLGATGAAIGLAFARLESLPGIAGLLLSLLVAAGSGALEATLVGLAQWWALHPWFPGIARRAWWLATLAGALVGYVLGFLPSTLMSLNAEASQAPVAEPPQWIVLLLAAGLGAVAGAVLSFAQWLVLRKEVRHAGWWIPANMLAWLAGMPIIFRAAAMEGSLATNKSSRTLRPSASSSF